MDHYCSSTRDAEGFSSYSIHLLTVFTDDNPLLLSKAAVPSKEMFDFLSRVNILSDETAVRSDNRYLKLKTKDK